MMSARLQQRQETAAIASHGVMSAMTTVMTRDAMTIEIDATMTVRMTETTTTGHGTKGGPATVVAEEELMEIAFEAVTPGPLLVLDLAGVNQEAAIVAIAERMRKFPEPG